MDDMQGKLETMSGGAAESSNVKESPPNAKKRRVDASSHTSPATATSTPAASSPSSPPATSTTTMTTTTQGSDASAVKNYANDSVAIVSQNQDLVVSTKTDASTSCTVQDLPKATTAISVDSDSVEAPHTITGGNAAVCTSEKEIVPENTSGVTDAEQQQQQTEVPPESDERPPVQHTKEEVIALLKKLTALISKKDKFTKASMAFKKVILRGVVTSETASECLEVLLAAKHSWSTHFYPSLLTPTSPNYPETTTSAAEAYRALIAIAHASSPELFPQPVQTVQTSLTTQSSSTTSSSQPTISSFISAPPPPPPSPLTQLPPAVPHPLAILDSLQLEASTIQALVGTDIHNFNMACGKLRTAIEVCANAVADAKRKHAAHTADTAPPSNLKTSSTTPGANYSTDTIKAGCCGCVVGGVTVAPHRRDVLMACMQMALCAMRQPSRMLWAKPSVSMVLGFALEHPDVWSPDQLSSLHGSSRSLIVQQQVMQRKGPQSNRFDDDTRRWKNSSVSKAKQAGI